MVNRFDVLIVNVKMLVSIVIFDDFGGLLKATIDDYSRSSQLLISKTTTSDEFILFDKKE